MSLRRLLRIIVLFCLFCSGCGHLAFLPTPIPLAEPLVRVAVVRQAQDFILEVRGSLTLVDLARNKPSRVFTRLRPTRVFVNDDGLYLGNETYFTEQLSIVPDHDGTLFINDRCYRGSIHILRHENDQISVINSLGLESYVKGVLYHEISDRWPMEAIKAQAVAARSYVLAIMQRTKAKDYDVTDNVYSQVYGGRLSEKYRTNLGVDHTRGMVLAYEKKILLGYYHATCGGHTENVRELWGEGPRPLHGVRCAFCSRSPHDRWKRNLRLKDIQDKLIAAGHSLGLIREIRVIDRNQSGRIRELEILDRQGQSMVISGKDFRHLLGHDVIKSNNYDIEMQGYYIDFLGRGWGHGVGMCQWGAYFMSRQGYGYKAILQYYYPGAQIIQYQALGL